MSVLAFLSGLIAPVTDLVKDLVVTDEDRAKMDTVLLKVKNEFSSKILEYEGKLLQAQSNIIVAEAQGQSWLQRNWRPITMLTFLVLVVCDSFGLLTFRLSGEAWTLLQLGLGGYVFGRSGEKIVKELKKRG